MLGGVCHGRLARCDLECEYGHVMVGRAGNVLNGLAKDLLVVVHEDLVLGNKAMVDGESGLNVGQIFAPLIERAVQVGVDRAVARVGQVTRGEDPVSIAALVGVPVAQQNDGSVACQGMCAVVDQLCGKGTCLVHLGIDVTAKEEQLHAAFLILERCMVDAARGVTRDAAVPGVRALLFGLGGAPEVTRAHGLKAVGLPCDQRDHVPLLLVERAVEVAACAGIAVAAIPVFLEERLQIFLPAEVDLAEHDQVGILGLDQRKRLVVAVCDKGDVLVVVGNAGCTQVILNSLDRDGAHVRTGDNGLVVRDLVIVDLAGAGQRRAHGRAVRVEYHGAVVAVVENGVVGNRPYELAVMEQLQRSAFGFLVQLEILIRNDKEMILIQRVSNSVQENEGLPYLLGILGGVVKPQGFPVLVVVNDDGNLARAQHGGVTRADQLAGFQLIHLVGAVGQRDIGKGDILVGGVVNFGVGEHVGVVLDLLVALLPLGIKADFGDDQPLARGGRLLGKRDRRAEHQGAKKKC